MEANVSEQALASAVCPLIAICQPSPSRRDKHPKRQTDIHWNVSFALLDEGCDFLSIFGVLTVSLTLRLSLQCFLLLLRHLSFLELFLLVTQLA